MDSSPEVEKWTPQPNNPSERFSNDVANPFNPRPPTLAMGDNRASKIHLTVGIALSTWEHTELQFAHLFCTFIQPDRGAYPARRAYGAIMTSRGRADLIQAAAPVFFRNFPSAQLQENLRLLMNVYGDAGARRNDIAHGIVMHGPGQSGHYLVAAFYTSKRSVLRLESSYSYASAQIQTFTKDFTALGCRARNLFDCLIKHYRASPTRAREPY